MAKAVAQFTAGPSGLRFNVRGGGSLDLTTVTGVVLSVTRLYDGSTATWLAVPVAGATKIFLQAIYTLAADGSDLAVLGDYDVALAFQVPGATRPIQSQRSIHFLVCPDNRIPHFI